LVGHKVKSHYLFRCVKGSEKQWVLRHFMRKKKHLSMIEMLLVYFHSSAVAAPHQVVALAEIPLLWLPSWQSKVVIIKLHIKLS